jgi:putative ABC transport system permease protein
MGPIAMLLAQSFTRGLRLLTRDAAFTLLAVCLLATGQAATIALLTTFDAVILRPLPYPQPDRLAFVWSTRTTQNQGVLLSPVAVPDFRAWRTRARSLAVGSFIYTEMNVGGATIDPELAQGARVSTDLFDIMGVAPAIGRTFRPDEGQFGSHRVAIVSHDYWQRRFDSAADAVGRTVLIDGEPHTIVGVLPAGMAFMDNVPLVHVFTPLAVLPGGPLDTRAQRPLIVFARLRDGFTLDQAQTELSLIAKALERGDSANAGIGVRVNSAREQTAGFAEHTLDTLLGAVGLLLLTACLNAAGLLLTRTIARRGEFGLRASLGARRSHIIVQVLAETLPISLVSALLAVPLALAMIGAIGSQLPWTLPRHNPIVLNARVVIMVAAMWMVLTVGLAVPPAIHACRVDLLDALGGHGRAGGLKLPSVFVRKLLMVCQIALAVALLLGAGLLARTTIALHHVALGFAVDHVITCRIPFPVLKYPLPSDVRAGAGAGAGVGGLRASAVGLRAAVGADIPPALTAATSMLARVRAVPGVQSAGLGSLLPMGYGSWWVRRIAPDAAAAATAAAGGTSLPIAQLPTAKVAFVSPDYLDTLGVTLRQGRFFSDRDSRTGEPVAIVNEAFARSMLTRSQAIGQRVLIVRPGDAAEAAATRGTVAGEPAGAHAVAAVSPDVRTIIGTIGNIRDSHVEREPEPEIYLPLDQFAGEGWSNTLAMAIRTHSAAPGDVMAAVRHAVAAVDPDQPISQIATTTDLLERRLARARFSVQLVTAVALLAVACVSLGIFGIFAYIARLRRAEFAVRLAVGARPSQIARAVLVEGLWLAGFGLAAGVIAIVLLVPWFASELYGVAHLDAALVAGVAAIITVVTLASLLVPARDAARLDATACLR